jgi:hydroxymethylpyrimidine pyrophosphatase-like HAD family hydrolase
MGKPYATELNALADTYAWCMAQPVDALAASVRAASRLPLLAVGSGGSFTSAALAAFLHTRYTGKVARAVPPYDLISSPAYFGDLAVLLLSAGGSNPDVLTAFIHAARREPASLGFLCTKVGSPLRGAAEDFPWARQHEFSLPVEKDGFLATNSLLGTSLLLLRAYAKVWPGDQPLPESLDRLLHPVRSREEFLAELDRECRQLWVRPTLLVLHGHATYPAAADIESKFTEAALAAVQLADYRNFAHGRHHWLARHAQSSSVLALATAQDGSVPERTLALLPDDVPVVRLDFPAGPVGAVGAIAASLHLAGLAGRAAGVDPGRPHVAPFGRKLYHLAAKPAPEIVTGQVPEEEAAAVERKAGASVTTLEAQGMLGEWRRHYARFLEALRGAHFGAVVFDYDGTLCGANERYTGPCPAVTEHLLRLLGAGLYVGVATGRGKSVKKDLRDRIGDRSFWPHVVVGYHNGAEVGSLDDEGQPPAKTAPDASLAGVVAALQAEERLAGRVALDAGNLQVTLELTRADAAEEVWEVVERALRKCAPTGVSALRSSHSVDLLAPGVTKGNLLERIKREVGRRDRGGEVLCIGDRGRWPGNDFALLQCPYSLSVDEVSRDPETCWNLARPGSRCVEACLEYLARMEARSGGGMRLSL